MGQTHFQGQAGIHSTHPGEKLHLIQQGSSWTLLTRHPHVSSAEIFSSSMKREQRALYLRRVVLKCKELVASAAGETYISTGRTCGNEGSPEMCALVGLIITSS